MLAHGQATQGFENISEPGMDFFILVRQWGPAFCYFGGNCTNEAYETFTIHGLWPNYNNGSHPQFCDCADPFSLPML
ncbi:hypothetical protein ACKKBG_A16370 [Auxenochlorella protothecoides x Auxenochlorella symbiontica]